MTKPVSDQGARECPRCFGRGFVQRGRTLVADADNSKECPDCRGTGSLTPDEQRQSNV